MQLIELHEALETLIDYRGKTPAKSSSGVLLVTAKVIKDGFINLDDNEYIPESEYDVWMRRGLPAVGDVLITTEAPLGQVARLGDASVALAQRVILLRANESIVTSSYLYHSLQGPEFQAEIQKRATGTTVLGIKQSELRRALIRVPELSAQRRVSRVLDSISLLIDNNRRRLRALEEACRIIVVRAAGNGQLVATRNTASGAGMRPMLDLFRVVSGGTPDTGQAEYWGGDIPFFTPRDVGASFYCLSTEKHLTEDGLDACRSELFPENTVFITARGTVGKLVLADVPMAMNQSCYALIPSEGVSPCLVLVLMREMRSLLESQANGSVFGTIVIDTFRDLLVRDFSSAELARLGAALEPRFELVRRILRANATLRKLRDLLLPKLLSGEIDPSRLPLPPEEVT